MVYIIIISFINYQDTQECLSSIKKLKHDSFATIIVDNSNNNDFLDSIDQDNKTQIKNYEDVDLNILKQKQSITIIKSCINKGFAAANNTALKLLNENNVSYNYVWLLNNDTTVDENSLQYMVNDIEKAPSNVGIIGSKLMHFDNPSIIQSYGAFYNKYLASCKPIGDGEIDHGQYDSYGESDFDYVVGASMLVKKDFIESVGFMNEIYFLYFEELDWILRGKDKNWTYMNSPLSRIYHKGGGSTINKGKISEFADKKQIRSRIIFTYLYYPKLLPLIISICLFSILRRLLKYGKKRAKAIALEIFYVIKEIRKGNIQCKY